MDTPKYIPTIDSLEKLDELMTSLFREQGVIGRWEEFEGSTEGGPLPGGIPKLSGTILAEDGRVFYYWLSWDSEKQAPDGTRGWYTLGENRFFEYEGKKVAYFREILPSEKDEYPKPDDSSFLEAKKKLGLA